MRRSHGYIQRSQPSIIALEPPIIGEDVRLQVIGTRDQRLSNPKQHVSLPDHRGACSIDVLEHILGVQERIERKESGH